MYQADLDARREAELEAARKAELRLRSQAVQRDLPRPQGINRLDPTAGVLLYRYVKVIFFSKFSGNLNVCIYFYTPAVC